MEFDAPLLLVEEQALFDDVVSSLAKTPVIAFDTESDSFHHYQEKVCLIQISDGRRDIIVDTLAVPDLSSIGDILSNPKQIKVLHGADYDVVCLKRDYGFNLRGLFDTMVGAQFLAFPHVGLADVLEATFGVSLDKRLQRYDWARRPLLPEHLEYARSDTHWLLPLHEVMVHRLGRVGLFDAVLEECGRIEEREWSGRKPDPDDFLRVKGSAALREQGRRVLRQLYRYRDDEARRMNRPPFKVIPDPVLMRVAEVMPTDLSALSRIIRSHSPLMRAHGTAIVRAVNDGIADDSQLPKASSRQRARAGPHPAAAGLFHQVLTERFRAWRNALVASGQPAVLVASNALIKELASRAPTTPEELEALPDIRKWQVRTYGDEILELVRKVREEFANPPPRSARKRHRRRVAEEPGEDAESQDTSASTEPGEGDLPEDKG
jgi:ribonuclease D